MLREVLSGVFGLGKDTEFRILGPPGLLSDFAFRLTHLAWQGFLPAPLATKEETRITTGL